MAYIGTSPSNGVRRRFVYEATANQTSFSGNDENGITLTYVDSLYLDVYQNGVKLKAGDDYTATTGTTVVLVQGASVNDVVEMISFDVFSVNDSVSASAGGSFAGNVGMGGTLLVSGDVTIGDTSAADKKILFDGNAQDFHIGLDDSIDSLTIGKGSALGTTTSMVIDANGIITQPLQPAFLAINASQQNNIAVGSDVTVVFGTEVFDQGGNFATNTFTAPIAGKYQLQTTLRVQTIDAASAYYYVLIKTTLRNYIYIIDPDFGQDNVYLPFSMSVLANMDAGDTAFIAIYQASGTSQSDVNTISSFSGYLVA